MDKKLLIIANWKSHKTTFEAKEWLEKFQENYSKINHTNKEIIICPPFTALSTIFTYIKQHNLPLSIGSQDVSGFEEGPYTGEVAASMVAEFAIYSIIGHSERRKNFCETDYTVVRKVEAAKQSNLKSIVCFQDENTSIPEQADILAYEPVFAIGTGNADTPENIKNVFDVLHKKTNGKLLLYGGSVDKNNIQEFAKIPLLSGFLIATASLDPNNFIDLLQQC